MSEISKNPASIRLSAEDTAEMAKLGITNPSEYVRYRLRQPATTSIPNTQQSLAGLGELEVQAKKMTDELWRQKEHEELKVKHAELKSECDKWRRRATARKKQLEEAEKSLGSLSMAEKFLPGIINGLAYKFPRQAEVVANSLAGVLADKSEMNTISEEEQQHINFSQGFQQQFAGDNYVRVVKVLEAIKMNENIDLLSKIEQLIIELTRNK